MSSVVDLHIMNANLRRLLIYGRELNMENLWALTIPDAAPLGHDDAMPPEPETGPQLAFEGLTPYDVYVRTDLLHSIQRTYTNEPTEQAFLVISQVMELYLGLLRFEFQRAQSELREDQVRVATDTLRRSVHHFAALNSSWASLRWMTPVEFNRFRGELGVASGFQSWAYRHVEFLLGLKNRSHTRLYENNPDVYLPLCETLESRSLYDDVIALLNRRGYDVPCPEGDLSHEYVEVPAVAEAWVSIMLSTDDETEDLRALALVLSDIAEAFDDWRWLHLKSVRRSMGAKIGTGGSSGISWLQRSMARQVFPELWSARTEL